MYVHHFWTFKASFKHVLQIKKNGNTEKWKTESLLKVLFEKKNLYIDLWERENMYLPWRRRKGKPVSWLLIKRKTCTGTVGLGEKESLFSGFC